MNKKLTKKQINYLKSFKEGEGLICCGDFYFFKDMSILEDCIKLILYNYDGIYETFTIDSSKDLEVLRKYGEEDYLTAIDFDMFTEFVNNFSARFENMKKTDKFLQNFKY